MPVEPSEAGKVTRAKRVRRAEARYSLPPMKSILPDEEFEFGRARASQAREGLYRKVLRFDVRRTSSVALMH